MSEPSHTPSRRIDFECRFKVLSELHIGSGETGPAPDCFKDEKLDRHPEMALLQRDHNDDPFIPGSALKGMLRAHCKADIAPLFGDHEAARMGQVLVRGSRTYTPGATDGLTSPETGVFIRARTAIDQGRGVAARGKLFHKEMIAPGACFTSILRLEARGEPCEASLLSVLAVLARENGAPLGANAASSLGRVRLEELTRTAWSTNTATGAFEPGATTRITLEKANDPEPHLTLTLKCPAPFLTRDYAYERTKDSEDPHIRALRYGDAPFITGDAVSAALRSRLEWLARIDACRADAEPSPIAAHLFGTTGHRARVRVEVSDATRETPITTTSVRIDRFSGGTIDNALFMVDADCGVTLTVRLFLDERRTDEDCRAALGRLHQDIRRNGLQLGAGAGRGFGWFRMEEAVDA